MKESHESLSFETSFVMIPNFVDAGVRAVIDVTSLLTRSQSRGPIFCVEATSKPEQSVDNYR